MTADKTATGLAHSVLMCVRMATDALQRVNTDNTPYALAQLQRAREYIDRAEQYLRSAQ